MRALVSPGGCNQRATQERAHNIYIRICTHVYILRTSSSERALPSFVSGCMCVYGINIHYHIQCEIFRTAWSRAAAALWLLLLSVNHACAFIVLNRAAVADVTAALPTNAAKSAPYVCDAAAHRTRFAVYSHHRSHTHTHTHR